MSSGTKTIKFFVACIPAVLAGLVTFLVTKNPVLAFEAWEIVGLSIGGAAVGGAVGYGGACVVV